jgi:hypothetical protein
VVGPDLGLHRIGETLIATFAHAPREKDTAVGLCGVSQDPAVDAPIGGWVYTGSDDQNLPAEGVTDGQVSFPTAGLAAGRYYLALTDTPRSAAPSVIAGAELVCGAEILGTPTLGTPRLFTPLVMSLHRRSRPSACCAGCYR